MCERERDSSTGLITTSSKKEGAGKRCSECVCVRERERERERNKQTDRLTDRLQHWLNYHSLPVRRKVPESDARSV